MKPYLPHAVRDFARYELSQDNRERGLELWEEAKALFEKVGADFEVARMQELPPEYR
jgi:hypothetical protein